MKWDIKIKKLDNGWLIEYFYDGKERYAFTFNEEIFDDDKLYSQKADALVDLLYFVLRGLGEENSKHNRYIINISKERGEDFVNIEELDKNKKVEDR